MHLRKNTTLLLELILKANSFKMCFQAHSNLFSSCELLKLLLEQLYLEAGLQNTEEKEKEKRDNFYSLTVDIVSSEFRQCYCITTRFLRQNISLGTVQNNKVGCEKQSGWANRKEKTAKW